MLTRTEALSVVRFANWDIDGKSAVRKDGSVVEFVELQAPGETRTRRITIDPSINGSRPAAGTTAAVDLDMVVTAEARTGRDGRPFVAYKDKLTVRAFHPVKA